jgi:aspartyl aminopeptidase
METQLVHELLNFIDNSPSMFHATLSSKTYLENAGFIYLDPKESWKLNEGGQYYTTFFDSSLIAFTIGEGDLCQEGFRIVGAHTDVPGFKVKPNPHMSENTYVKLNTEVYGGPIYNTWLDRPLSLAGRVALKGDTPLKPKLQLVDLKDPLLVIPSLAIHMNREVNSGVKLNQQKELLPILGYVEENLELDSLKVLVAKALDVTCDAILDMDLYLYPVEKSMVIGQANQFISAPRLDDLSMVFSGLYGLTAAKVQKGINVLALFDNEEVGSRSKQGADSPVLANVLERIMIALEKTNKNIESGSFNKEDYYRALTNSFMLSADVAHLIHPNYAEKSDPTNKVLPGGGPAVKIAASASYTTDSDSFATFAHLCSEAKIPYQVFVNRSDERGGSTIGPVSASHLPIRSIDIGTPMLSMHSCRELMATKDFLLTAKVLTAFYNL